MACYISSWATHWGPRARSLTRAAACRARAGIAKHPVATCPKRSLWERSGTGSRGRGSGTGQPLLLGRAFLRAPNRVFGQEKTLEIILLDDRKSCVEGNESGQEHRQRFKFPAEGIQDHARGLAGDDAEKRVVSGFAKDHRGRSSMIIMVGQGIDSALVCWPLAKVNACLPWGSVPSRAVPLPGSVALCGSSV